MKKIFTLMVTAMLAMAAFAAGDNTFQFCDKNGNVIPDGSTITASQVVEDDLGDLIMPTGVYVKCNDEAYKVGLEIKIESMTDGKLMSCFPDQCHEYTEVGTYDNGKALLTELSNGIFTKFEIGEMIPAAGKEAQGKVTFTISKWEEGMFELGQEDKKLADCSTITVLFGKAGEALIYADDVTANAGESFDLSVKMRNGVPMTGFQFDVEMPAGLSIAVEDDYYCIDLSTERTTTRNTNTFDSALQKDGSVRVLAGSTKSKTFSGTDGEVAIITVNVDKDIAAGVYTIVFKNIVMSDEVGNTYKVERSECDVTVGSADGINQVTTASALNGKYVEAGKVVILNNGKQYNAAGAKLF